MQHCKQIEIVRWIKCSIVLDYWIIYQSIKKGQIKMRNNARNKSKVGKKYIANLTHKNQLTKIQ